MCRDFTVQVDRNAVNVMSCPSLLDALHLSVAIMLKELKRHFRSVASDDQ